MGNTQCLGTESNRILYADNNIGSYPWLPGSRDFEFLKLHLQERAEKCIIDPQSVIEALALQLEELLRRELEEGAPQNCEEPLPADFVQKDLKESRQRSNALSTSGASAIYAQTELSGFLSSFTPSATTTSYSASTFLTGNYKKYSEKRDILPYQKNQPPPILGNTVDLNDNLYSELYRLIAEVVKDGEGKKKKPLVLTLGRSLCSALPHSVTDRVIMSLASQDNALAQNKMHMIVLHLYFPAQCGRSLGSEWLPDSPLVYNAYSDWVPQRKQNCPLRTDPPSPPSKDISFGGPPSQPLNLWIRDSPFLDLGITGCLGLVEPPSTPSKRQQLPPIRYKVLLNRRSGVPLAVCALKNGPRDEPVVRVYATKIRTHGQRPAATTAQLGLNWTDSLPLYSWAEIVAEGKYPNPVKYSMFMATGSDGRFLETPSYLGKHSYLDSPEVRVLGMTDSEDEYTGCALLCLTRGGEDSDQLYFRISVSKGVDPALMICFASFVDEFMERKMRMQYELGPRSV